MAGMTKVRPAVGVSTAMVLGGVVLGSMALGAAPASADPWEGIWAHERALCQYPVGETDGSPWRLTRKAFRFYEGGCDVMAITPLKGVRAWIVDLKCASEGERFNPREVLMLTREGKLARFSSDGDLFEMVRCP